MGFPNVVSAAYASLVSAGSWRGAGGGNSQSLNLLPSFSGPVTSLSWARRACLTNLTLLCVGRLVKVPLQKKEEKPAASGSVAGWPPCRRGSYLWCFKKSAAAAKRGLGLLCKAELLRSGLIFSLILGDRVEAGLLLS